MQKITTIDVLREYVDNNEVVYLFCGDLIEVSNEIKKIRKTLLGYFCRTNRVDIYKT